MAVKKLGPFSPKFHGAWLGSLGGVDIGAIVVGLIQTDFLHHALSLPIQTLIESVTTAAVAAIGAYILPLLPGLKVADVLAQTPTTATGTVTAAGSPTI